MTNAYGNCIIQSSPGYAGRFQDCVARSRWNLLRSMEVYADQVEMARLGVVPHRPLLLDESESVLLDQPDQLAEPHWTEDIINQQSIERGSGKNKGPCA